MKHFSTIADTQLFRITVNGFEYLLVSDNGGQNGMVYLNTDTIGTTPHDNETFGLFEDGIVYRKGVEIGPGIVSFAPLPDETLDGFVALKKNPLAIFRHYGENN